MEYKNAIQKLNIPRSILYYKIKNIIYRDMIGMKTNETTFVGKYEIYPKNK